MVLIIEKFRQKLSLIEKSKWKSVTNLEISIQYQERQDWMETQAKKDNLVLIVHKASRGALVCIH